MAGNLKFYTKSLIIHSEESTREPLSIISIYNSICIYFINKYFIAF